MSTYDLCFCDKCKTIYNCMKEGAHTCITEDNVNHPAHYTVGKIEVIDFIEDQSFPYHLGNAIKYISRARYKGNYEEDLKKAIWYLERELQKNAKHS